jgi:hypothetical protein
MLCKVILNDAHIVISQYNYCFYVLSENEDLAFTLA